MLARIPRANALERQRTDPRTHYNSTSVPVVSASVTVALLTASSSASGTAYSTVPIWHRRLSRGDDETATVPEPETFVSYVIFAPSWAQETLL